MNLRIQTYTTLQVEIKKELRASVKIAAAEMNIPMKEFVTLALNEKLKKENKK